MKFYQTPQFKKLDEEWKEKLKSTGFVDLENNQERLRQWCKNLRARYLPSEEKIKYYYLIREGTLKYPLASKLHLFIMSAVGEGRTLKSIHREILKKGEFIHYDILRVVVKRYEYQWGIKSYTKAQLRLKSLPTKL